MSEKQKEKTGVSPELSKYFSALGKKGGATNKAKYGPDYFKKIGKKGNKAKAAKRLEKK